MKRRAFLAALFIAPVAAKIPAPKMVARRLTVKYTSNDMQFLESRSYQIGEIYKVFQVDPARIVEIGGEIL